MNETLEDDLAQQLHDTFGLAETADAWLRTPNPVLAGDTPMTYLQRDDMEAVRKLLLMADTGMPIWNCTKPWVVAEVQTRLPRTEVMQQCYPWPGGVRQMAKCGFRC